MTDANLFLPIITLNINELNIPIKRWQRLEGWMKIHDPPIHSLQETHLLDTKIVIGFK